MNVSLTTHMQPIAVLHTDGPEITIGKHLPANVLRRLCETGGIVLWDYEGLWGVLDQPRLKALLKIHEDITRLAAAYLRIHPGAITMHHSDTLQIVPTEARFLLATEDSPTW